MKALSKIACAMIIMHGAIAPASSLAQAMNFDTDEFQSAAQGNTNNTDDRLTSEQAVDGGVVGGRNPSLPPTYYNLCAVNSVNNAPFPSGSFTYGFPTSPGGGGHSGFSSSLPPVSTSSVDLNTCNNSGGEAQFSVSAGPGGISGGVGFSAPGFSAGVFLSSDNGGNTAPAK
jgi:hypothetical protein